MEGGECMSGQESLGGSEFLWDFVLKKKKKSPRDSKSISVKKRLNLNNPVQGEKKFQECNDPIYFTLTKKLKCIIMETRVSCARFWHSCAVYGRLSSV